MREWPAAAIDPVAATSIVTAGEGRFVWPPGSGSLFHFRAFGLWTCIALNCLHAGWFLQQGVWSSLGQPQRPQLSDDIWFLLGKRGWLRQSGAIQPKNMPSFQNNVLLPFIQFVPAQIHHGYVAQMKLQNSLPPGQFSPEVNYRLICCHALRIA